jgi:hypothetical protein
MVGKNLLVKKMLKIIGVKVIEYNESLIVLINKKEKKIFFIKILTKILEYIKRNKIT